MTNDMSLPLEGVDFFVRYMKLPPKIYAFIGLNPDGTYNMFLDPNRSYDQQLEDYIHELWHIIRDDMYSDRPIGEIEAA